MWINLGLTIMKVINRLILLDQSYLVVRVKMKVNFQEWEQQGFSFQQHLAILVTKGEVL